MQKALAAQEPAQAVEPVEDYAESAYWRFDARHKGYAEWKSAPMSERDAFKAEMRAAIYTHPAPAKPLSDEQIFNLDKHPHVMFDAERLDFARAVIAEFCKLSGIKETSS